MNSPSSGSHLPVFRGTLRVESLCFLLEVSGIEKPDTLKGCHGQLVGGRQEMAVYQQVVIIEEFMRYGINQKCLCFL